VKVLIEDVEEEDDLKVIVHQQEDDSDASAEECEFNDCIRTVGVTNITPSVDKTQLEVVKCTLAQPEQINWGRPAIFQTCTKIGNKS